MLLVSSPSSRKELKSASKKYKNIKGLKYSAQTCVVRKQDYALKVLFLEKSNTRKKASMFPIFVNLSMENINEESKKWFRTVV
jgi:hypothetical protein